MRRGAQGKCQNQRFPSLHRGSFLDGGAKGDITALSPKAASIQPAARKSLI
jgi:hypothetical protein